MAMNSDSVTALKEWASVVEALKDGRQILMLRKGGLADVGKSFSVKESEFFLYPNVTHQEEKHIRPDQRASIERDPLDKTVHIDTYAVVERALDVKELAPLHRLGEYHIWEPSFIDMRFNYKPQNPLWLLLTRAYRLPKTIRLHETDAYRGCKSWVPLMTRLSTAGATPVLTDAEFVTKVAGVEEALGITGARA